METKKESKVFLLHQYKEEEQYLRKQHQAGWKFVKTGKLATYHFEKCEPEDVIYRLDYNPEGNANKDEYIRMFADCGWEYIQEFSQFSYFRKPADQMDGEEDIFNDEAAHLTLMKRILTGRMLPLFVIFIAALMPQFARSLSDGSYVRAAVLGAVLLLYIVIFAGFAIRYYRLKNNA